jgi:hypothetical protein
LLFWPPSSAIAKAMWFSAESRSGMANRFIRGIPWRGFVRRRRNEEREGVVGSVEVGAAHHVDSSTLRRSPGVEVLANVGRHRRW